MCLQQCKLNHLKGCLSCNTDRGREYSRRVFFLISSWCFLNPISGDIKFNFLSTHMGLVKHGKLVCEFGEGVSVLACKA